MTDLATLMRMLRLAMTPGTTIRRRIGRNAVVSGRNRKGHGMRALYLYGEDCEGGLGLLQLLLGEGETMIDVGANIGMYSLLAGELVGPSGCVIAVEPWVETAARLYRNAADNGFDHVRVRVCAMGGSPGHAALHLNRNRPVSFSLLGDGDQHSSVDVSVETIDDLALKEGVKRVDFLKLDVEGVEHDVLLGGKNTIQRWRPVIQYESYQSDAHEDVLADYRRFRFVNVAGNRWDSNTLAIPSESPKLARATALRGKLRPVE